MATFKRSVITEKGKEYISRALSNNTKILLNRIESTEYVYVDTVDITKILNLDNPKQSVNISEITKNKEKVKIRGIFTNDGLNATYKMNAIGVYAKDDMDNEILFAILIAENPDTISPPQGQSITTITLDLIFVLSDEVNVSLTVDNNALVSMHTHNEFKKFVEKNYIKKIDYATEETHGIAKLYSSTEAETDSDRVKEIIEKNTGNNEENGKTKWAKLFETLDHTKILTVQGLVKFLSKLLKPAGEDDYGLINYKTIKQVSPKPDLSPYIPFSKGYRNTNNSDFVLRGNSTNCWAPRYLNMYLENGDYMGCFHVNGGRAYYKVPNRNGGNWCEIMDNHDMAARDSNIQHAHNRITDTWNHAHDAWNKAHDAQVNRIYEIRLAGYIWLQVGISGASERNGYVITGLYNDEGSDFSQGDHVQMRVLQFHRNGQWMNAYFA